MNRIWRKREPLTQPIISSQHYDADFNIIVTDTNRLGVTEKYILSEKSLNQVPCSRLEKLVFILSSTPHQSLLMLHINLQG